MPPIAAGVFLTCVSNMYTNILIYYKKTHYIMFAAIVAAFVNIVLNWVFIRLYGYMAAAYTTLIAYIVLAAGQGVCAWMVCKKIRGGQNLVYNDKAICLMAVATIMVALTGLILYRHTLLRYCAIIVCLIIITYLGVKYISRKKNKRTFT